MFIFKLATHKLYGLRRGLLPIELFVMSCTKDGVRSHTTSLESSDLKRQFPDFVAVFARRPKSYVVLRAERVQAPEVFSILNLALIRFSTVASLLTKQVY